jgi:hypothetical protein
MRLRNAEGLWREQNINFRLLGNSHQLFKVRRLIILGTSALIIQEPELLQVQLKGSLTSQFNKPDLLKACWYVPRIMKVGIEQLSNRNYGF